jgi:MFS family permease
VNGPPPVQDPRLIRAVFGATFFVRFGFGLELAVFATYLAGKSVGLTQGEYGTIGLLSALAPLGEFTTVLLSGIVADRYGRVQVLLAGLAGAAVLMVVASTTRSPAALGTVNFLFGVAAGAILASSLAVVADHARSDSRGLQMGRFDAVNLLGWIVGFALGLGILGATTVDHLGYVFVIAAGLLAISFAVAYVWSRGAPPSTHLRTVDLGELRRAVLRKDVLLVVVPWFVIYMLIGTALVFLGTSSNMIGISPTYIAVAIGVGGLLLLLTQPTYGRLADKYGRMRLMTIGTFGFVGVLTAASLIAGYGANPAFFALLGISALAALAYGPAALAALTDLSQALTRATTMALYTLVISLGMLVGLAGAAGLSALLGRAGVVLFFSIIAAALVVLMVVRYRDLRETRPAIPADSS